MKKLISLTLEEAEKLAMETDYAVFAVEPEGNEINQADAGAFFLEGFQYAMELIFGASNESLNVADSEDKRKICSLGRNYYECSYWRIHNEGCIDCEHYK